MFKGRHFAAMAAVAAGALGSGVAPAAAAEQICVADPAVTTSCQPLPEGTYDAIGAAWSDAVAPGACVLVAGTEIPIAGGVAIAVCRGTGGGFATGVDDPLGYMTGLTASADAPSGDCRRRSASLSVSFVRTHVWMDKC